MGKMTVSVCHPENLGRFNFWFIGVCTVYLQFGVLLGFLFLWGLGDFFNRVPRHNSKTYLVHAKVLIKSQTSCFQLPFPKLNSQDRSAAKQTLFESMKEQGGENIMFSKDIYLSFMYNTMFFTGVYFGFFVNCRSKFNAEVFS